MIGLRLVGGERRVAAACIGAELKVRCEQWVAYGILSEPFRWFHLVGMSLIGAGIASAARIARQPVEPLDHVAKPAR